MKFTDAKDILTGVGLMLLILHSAFFMPGNFSIPLIAVSITLLWLFLYPTYEYVGRNRYIGKKINVFPLVAWTTVFVIAVDVHVLLFSSRFFLTVLLWIGLVIFAEWFGYHRLHIRINKDDPGIFGTDIIHGKPFLHAFYLLAVPLFVLGVERFLLG